MFSIAFQWTMRTDKPTTSFRARPETAHQRWINSVAELQTRPNGMRQRIYAHEVANFLADNDEAKRSFTFTYFHTSKCC